MECTKEINNAQGANAVAMEDMKELGVLQRRYSWEKLMMSRKFCALEMTSLITSPNLCVMILQLTNKVTFRYLDPIKNVLFKK